MAEYTGWLIEVRLAEDAFGDLSGYDVTASIRRFRDLLEADLVGRFPGATIDVALSGPTMSPITVTAPEGTPGYGYAPAGASLDDPAQGVLSGVQWAIERLFTGHGDDWAVDAN